MKKKLEISMRKFYHFARMADDIADHQNLSSNQKMQILKYFDNTILKKKQTNNKILNIILKFKEIPSGKNTLEIFLKLLKMDASK